jgi:hypothetical protein
MSPLGNTVAAAVVHSDDSERLQIQTVYDEEREHEDHRAERTGDLARLIDHVAHDDLVAWGWAPGPGRAPVPTPRADVVAAMRTWADAGAPCPSPIDRSGTR